MPTSYRGFPWGDFKVSVRPVGVRRALQWLPFNVPYFTGSNVDLILTIETSSREAQEFAYSWDCERFGSDDIAQSIEQGNESFLDNPQTRVERKITLPWLSSVGHHVIELQITHPIMQDTWKRERIVDFYAKEKEAAAITFFRVPLPILTGLLGLAIGKFILGICP